MEEMKIPYSLSKKSLYKYMAISLLGGICTTLLAYTNDQGVVIFKLIKLSTPYATIFYWTLSILMLVMMMTWVFIYIRGIRNKPQIIIGEDRLSAPINALAFRTVSIAYKDINDVKVTRTGYGSMITVKHLGGKLNIPENIIGQTFFDQIAIILEEKHAGILQDTPYNWN